MRIVAWGGTTGLESHRWIHRAFVETARKMGWEAWWCSDTPDNRSLLTPGTIVITADIYATMLGYAVPGVNYVIHNLDASHPLCQTCEPDRLLRLQVFTNDSFGEKWDDFRLYHRESHLLFQPWGTNLLPEEFYEPVFNLMNTGVVFVGAVWSDVRNQVELGNLAMIEELKEAVAEHRLNYLSRTHISNDEMIELVRRCRLAPSFASGWQVEHGYLPCRAFKNVSYGTLGVTNVVQLAEKLGCPLGSITEQFDWALGLRRHSYLSTVKEQQRFVAKYTYRESLLAIQRAFRERNVETS